MGRPKVFISHSHKDKIIADGLVDLLIKIGVSAECIISSSSTKAQLHVGESIYTKLRMELSEENVIVVFLLSDNFYSSTVCLNEMGAVWVNDKNPFFMILPGFSFDKVEGVITEKNRIGINLSALDSSNEKLIRELCDKIASNYDIAINSDSFELGLIGFQNSINEYKRYLVGKRVFSMDKADSCCVNDTDNDGCRIWNRESSKTKTTVIIDFSQTITKLCSVSYRVEQKDWSLFRSNGKSICFEIYSDSDTFQSEVEIHFSGHNKSVAFLISDDTQKCCIPLSQFSASDNDWKEVKELCFLFRKKHIDHRTTVVIENIRFE